MDVMKKNYPIFILSILLAAGSMFSSCVKDTHGDKTDPDDKETRCLALNVNLDNLTTTRANGSSTGIEQESQIYSIRIILYNSAGLAEYPKV